MQIQRTGLHPAAHVADSAVLGDGVTIGPGCVVGPHVRLGDGCVLHAHSVVTGDTWIGPETEVFPFAVIGSVPQDKKLRARAAELRDDHPERLGRLRIGARNEIREHVTIHGGTPFGSGETRIGDRNMFLVGSHVGHDAQIGDDVVLTNGALVAGHCEIEDRAILGAIAGIHQFCRVGFGAMVGAGSMVSHDVPPFGLIQGDRARLIGVNVVGLRRGGFSQQQVATVKRVFRILFWRGGLLEERIANARAFADGDPLPLRVVDFAATSKRGICAPRVRAAGPADLELGRE